MPYRRREFDPNVRLSPTQAGLAAGRSYRAQMPSKGSSIGPAPSYEQIRWAVQVVVLWDAHNVEHIARHGVTPNEVEEVVRTDKARWFTDDSVRPGRLVVLRPATSGRLLVIVFDRPTPSGLAYCLTARPMTRVNAKTTKGQASEKELRGRSPGRRRARVPCLRNDAG